MDRLLEDGLGLVDIELSLEGTDVVGEATAVCATAGVGEAEILVDDLLAGIAPVTSATAVLLHLLGVSAHRAVLRKVAREMLLGGSGSIGQTGVVTVVELVRASHLDESGCR